MLNMENMVTEKTIRIMIEKNLRKEIHPNTKPSMDFIYKILDDAYNSGVKYDVSDMRPKIMAFANSSTHQADYCLSLITQMKFKSDEPSENVELYDISEDRLTFFDVEVFPNLFLVNWKHQGENSPVIRMINPTEDDIKMLMKYKLVGFNVRRYDNHILYARMLGYSNSELYNLSQRIVNGSPNAMFGEAYNISYTDIYDFMSAGNKMSLKKWEIKLGIKHHELGLPWDEPVPEELWPKVAEYCDDDVLATEAVFNDPSVQADWTARKILADIAGGTVNDTTNSLTTKIIFGSNRKPQNEFCYRDLGKPVLELDPKVEAFLWDHKPKMMQYWKDRGDSKLPYFEGYVFENGKSLYRGEIVGEGGYAKGIPGVYGDAALLDVASMHPNSTIAECLFGPRYSKMYSDIVSGRVDIKHEDWEAIGELFDGKLVPYVDKVKNGEMTSKDLANALKTAINSVYGLTSASFINPFRDERNIDNIVAKRGALFMMTLRDEIIKRGFTVSHIKTDSLKIPDATPEIIEFVMTFGEWYGYEFEHEATYDRFALMNDAVYIAKYASKEKCDRLYSYVPGDNFKKGGKWTPTGAQFAQPYVFKTLFSKEPITLDDMCETKSATSCLYLDTNEDLPDVTQLEKELERWRRKNPGAEPPKELLDSIAEGHNYKFIGKVGQFCPMEPGVGAGVLVRDNKGSYAAVTGTKGYRFMETATVKDLGLEDRVDISYYRKFVDEAIHDISRYCDFEWFVSDAEYDKNYNEILPF